MSKAHRAVTASIYYCFALLLCGCESQPNWVKMSNENGHVQLDLDNARVKEDVPPDGSRILLVDGGDCVVRLQADGNWTITFAGGEPAVIVSSAKFLAQPTDMGLGMIFVAQFGGVGLSIPSCAAKEIAAGGCGAPAAKRAAARMLAGTYRLIGSDWHGNHARMALDLTDTGKKVLRDALEGKPTSDPTTKPMRIRMGE